MRYTRFVSAYGSWKINKNIHRIHYFRTEFPTIRKLQNYFVNMRDLNIDNQDLNDAHGESHNLCCYIVSVEFRYSVLGSMTIHNVKDDICTCYSVHGEFKHLEFPFTFCDCE